MGMFDDLIPQGAQEGGRADPKIGQPQELSFGEKLVSGVKFPAWVENIRGTAPVRVLQGMADPMIGGMQTIANALPDATGIPQAVNKRVGDLEKDYEAQRAARGSEGTDFARLAGNVASPVNLAIAAKAPLAATAGMRAAQGAAIGAGTAAMEPVVDTENGFWGKKSGQMALGAVGGAVLTPLLGKVGDAVVRRLQTESPNVLAARSAAQTDQAINAALQDLGQTIHDIPPAQLQALRDKVIGALSEGRQLDPAAAMRMADFESLGIKPTLGQVTRDPMQFAREQNLRGVEGVGEPLSARFQDQGTKLVRRLTDPAAAAKDAYNAGTQISDALSSTDDVLRKHVSGLYGEARASAGKELDVPLQGLASDYADILHRYGSNVPSGVRNVLEDFGLLSGKQNKVFNFEEADKALKAINANKSNDPAVNSALNELRGAVRKAVEGADASGGPFAPAVQAAAQRFKMHDAVPALKAAADGSVAPDDFVRRFIINGKTNDVKGLSQVLKQANPDAWQEARAQIADELRRGAFGENAGSDAPFAPTRYMATIRRLGADKIGAFFTTKEVSDFMTVGRVGGYMKQAPNASAVNTSNSAGTVANLLARVPGAGPIVAVGNKMASTVKNSSNVRNALAAQAPSTGAPLSEGQRNYLAYLLALGAGEGGALAARSVGQ